MVFIALLIVTYLVGALPWSVWLGRLFFRVDPRSLADGNPGAANAFRAGGWPLGATVLLLDFFKAFIPVVVVRWGMQLPANQVFWLALMPTVGHAFSIFLNFRGGRALVTWFGVWAGLTLYEVPVVMGGAAVAAVLILRNDVQRALLIPTVLLVYLMIQGAPGWMVALGVAQLVILALKIAVFYHSSSTSALPANSRLKS